ncbi:pentapeptide repeat-containing protein [Cryobacterium frigoriphilum]|uniref:pentapeptide repeat-containing protein n=1 Tax=Cryobacterium frigoriphilum TaxID=1259150 RepID=UPI003B96FC4D
MVGNQGADRGEDELPGAFGTRVRGGANLTSAHFRRTSFRRARFRRARFRRASFDWRAHEGAASEGHQISIALLGQVSDKRAEVVC